MRTISLFVVLTIQLANETRSAADVQRQIELSIF
jgi:hypothetical protein